MNSQIFLFATELFSVVNFLDDSEDAFNHLFLLNPNKTGYSIYTKNQFYFQVQHSVEQVSKQKASPVTKYSEKVEYGGGGGELCQIR